MAKKMDSWLKTNSSSKSTDTSSKKCAPCGDALKAEICQKAKDIWEKKGRPNGKDMENWVEAESIIKKKYGIK